MLRFTTRLNVLCDIQSIGNPGLGYESNLVSSLPGTGGAVTNVDPGAVDSAPHFYRLSLHF